VSGRQFLTLLSLAVLGIVTALYVTGRRDRTPEATGAALFPGLAARIADVSTVTIRRGATTPSVELRRKGAAWTVAERSDYPADVGKLRRLLLSLADARIVEEKTADPANYAALGVEDAATPGAVGTEVRFTVDAAAPAAQRGVIIGKSTGDGAYVRLAGTARSELVTPGISVETNPQYWIDTRLLDVAPAAIAALEVHPAAGPGYLLRRASGGGTDFALAVVPPGRAALESKALAPSPVAFGNLTAEDVAPASSVAFSAPATAILSLNDGNQLTLRGSPVGNQRWITVESTKNDALSAKTRGFAYELAPYRYDAIFRPLEQLLQPKPSAAAHSSAPVSKLTGAGTRAGPDGQRPP
jgi:hypothetical protein